MFQKNEQAEAENVSFSGHINRRGDPHIAPGPPVWHVLCGVREFSKLFSKVAWIHPLFCPAPTRLSCNFQLENRLTCICWPWKSLRNCSLVRI